MSIKESWTSFWEKYCIIAKAKTAAINLWKCHLQKSMGALLITLSSVDLSAAIVGVEGPVRELFGQRAYDSILLLAGLLVFYRSIKRPKPPDS